MGFNEMDIFVTTTGNFNIITLEHMKKMKNNAIVGNIGHFDNEIQMAELEGFSGIKVENIKPQLDRFDNWKNKTRYENKVYLLPKNLDEKVAKLHLGAIGAKITDLTQEQADYIGVKMQGPYKPDTYRY